MSKKYYVVTDSGIDRQELTQELYDALYDDGAVFDTFEEAATLAIQALSDRVKFLEKRVIK